ncbi:MAG TPA: acyl-CoA dehydrogenase family protein [Acidimicrobiales bacterium]|nr:acyl-CoA dehydrogenase family protein [Acidimicrobiales bacterium]
MSHFEEKFADVVRIFARDSADVDRANSIPPSHFDRLASLGLYGAFAPIELGGLGLSLTQLCDGVEELASACLATTFVWIQHFRLLAAVLDPNAPAIVGDLRQEIVLGRVTGGVALTGLQPGPAKLTAAPTRDGWVLDGEAPWVSGWGLVDLLVVAARGPDDAVVTMALDAQDRPGMDVTQRQLSALNATATVKLTFEALFVEGDRVLAQVPYDPTGESPESLRVNGSLALGVTRRCCDVIGPSALDNELRDARAELDGADAENIAKARARACELAVRASHALAVFLGSSSVLEGGIAERTAREAQLLLTFGSRPAIRHSLLQRFGAGDPSSL